MKIKNSDLKEMIRQAISEMTEGGPGSGRPTKPGSAKDIEKRAMSAADAANAKMDAAEKAAKAKKKVKEGGPGSGPHGDDEDNPFDREPSDDELKDIEKQFEGASSKTMKRIKDTMKYDALGDLEDVIDDYDIDKKYYRDIDRYLNAIRDVEQGMKPSGYDKPAKNNLLKVLKKAINESKVKRFTVKEVRMWMKKLEENRYKKVYNSDARRVAWMVNNEGVSLNEMPISMKNKWTKAQYGRERYLAKEFLNVQKAKLKEQKLRESIRNIIKRLI